MMSAVVAAIASGLAIAATLIAALLWILRLSARVAILEHTAGQITPVQIIRELAWLRGAVTAIARHHDVDLQEEPA